jgi:hypothetical protein
MHRRRLRRRIERDAGGDRQVNDDLRRLPKVQDDGVRRVGGSDEIRLLRRQAVRDARQMAANRLRPLRQHCPIDRAHLWSPSSTAA